MCSRNVLWTFSWGFGNVLNFRNYSGTNVWKTDSKQSTFHRQMIADSVDNYTSRLDLTELPTIWRHWRTPNLQKIPQIFSNSSPNIFQVSQTFSYVAKRYPCLPNVLLKFWKCAKSPNCRCFPQILTRSWQTIRRVRHMYVNCSPLFTKSSPKTENGEQLGRKQSNILRSFGDSLAKIWWTFGKMFAKYSPNLRHLFTKQLPNNLLFAYWSPFRHQMFAKRSQNNHFFIAGWSQNLPIICQFSTFLSPNCRLSAVNCLHLAVTPNFFNKGTVRDKFIDKYSPIYISPKIRLLRQLITVWWDPGFKRLDIDTAVPLQVQTNPSKHGPCGPVLVSDWQILAILAYRYANNYRHWSSLGKPISAKWCSANNLQYWSSLGKTIDRHYGNLYIW